MEKEAIARQLGIPTESVDDVIEFVKLLKKADKETKAEISIILKTVEEAVVKNKKKRR